MTAPAKANSVTHFEVQYAVSQALGEVKLASVITDEKIRRCQNMLEQAYADFFEDASTDLNQLSQAVEKHDALEHIPQIRTLIFNIRSLAKVLGMSLVTEVCVYCVNALDSEDWSPEKKVALVRKLVEALRLAFEQRITDDGGAAGQALLQKLRQHFA